MTCGAGCCAFWRIGVSDGDCSNLAQGQKSYKEHGYRHTIIRVPCVGHEVKCINNRLHECVDKHKLKVTCSSPATHLTSHCVLQGILTEKRIKAVSSDLRQCFRCNTKPENLVKEGETTAKHHTILWGCMRCRDGVRCSVRCRDGVRCSVRCRDGVKCSVRCRDGVRCGDGVT